MPLYFAEIWFVSYPGTVISILKFGAVIFFVLTNNQKTAVFFLYQPVTFSVITEPARSVIVMTVMALSVTLSVKRADSVITRPTLVLTCVNVLKVIRKFLVLF